MAAIIGHLLPLALGVALSSVPIVVMVLILLSPRSRWSALAYLIGAAVGLTGLTALFTAIASLLPPVPPAEPNPLIATIELVIGAALLALAVVRFARARRRARARRLAAAGLAAGPTEGHADAAADSADAVGGPADAPAPPAWMTRLTSLGPVPSLGVGFVLMLRPKNLLLTLAAGVAITAGGAPFGDQVVAVAVFVVLGISTLAVPILVALVDPARTLGPLRELRDWIARNSSTVTTVVLLVLGTVIIGSGLTRF
ncbi:GAP family protein [Herbiconiux sp. VKM Ac-1786]|uniref:GAP family protein n=1 Tax=Herbiconiux sp. VKM Ac-1786 TaxID=2783824 RepID=UPI00188CD3D0|nr:GAP family protein [Herbiconiux sp. VKM Ac-1786]MBF4573952.1 GAP family protein [Herbiconiux sp. VKM Ac-1786]